MAGIKEALDLTKLVGELVKKGVTLEAQERIADLRQAVLDVREELDSVREENRQLKQQVTEQDRWQERAARYTHVVAPGGAHVYHSDGPPPHYACPRCFEHREISILQDQRVMSGEFLCPGCDRRFAVDPERPLPDLY